MNQGGVTLKYRWVTWALSILTFAGIVFSLYKKPYRWDEAASKIEEVSKKVADHDIILAVLNSKLDIMASDLKEIKRAVK